MRRHLSGRAIALILIVLLAAIQFIYWRTLVYQAPFTGPAGGGGGQGPSQMQILAVGLEELQVTTLAGTGVPGWADGRAGRAQFDGPSGLAVDRAGSVFVADSRNHRIRRIASDGQVTTVAGSGPTGDVIGSFADGPAEQSRFWCPAGVAVDAAGALYVADTGNHAIRKIARGSVSTLAGGKPGYADGVGRAARFRSPVGVAVDAASNLYVADTGNAAVRKVEPSGRVTTLARGGGLQAPMAVSLAPGGGLLVSDPRAKRVFRLPTNGPATPAPVSFSLPEAGGPQQPAGVGAAPDGTRVVTDLARHVLFAERDGWPYLLAGVIQSEGARPGWLDATADKASFDAPFGVVSMGNSDFIVADYGNHSLRRIHHP